jgi:tetratricopeptide (TPR) repeat protein
MRALACFLLLGVSTPCLPRAGEGSGFRQALDAASSALASGDTAGARGWIQRALERDRKSVEAWAVRAQWARAIDDRDELVYALHREHALSVAQKRPRAEIEAQRTELEALDPLAKDLFSLQKVYLDRLTAVALAYEKDGRPHGAIRVWKKVLALDPENLGAQAAIERIAALPDPSLAGDAKPKDLFADVSQEWIREFDAEHSEWKDAGRLERPNYTTKTDAGYEVMVRAAEAMEQMNAFYREFFRYGTPEDKKSIGRIDLLLFKNRDEYLKLGSSPAEWSGGQFTGSAVETYMSGGGFETLVGVLFHEAAHQFVGLATNATGWLNEGLASFFEGTRILPNGTVIMNMPANDRLFPLADRMAKGWMSSASDGIDSANVEKEPERSPTFRIVLEDEYAWGPPWYAPTWGVVYFLYNYQDAFDGRFVYRDAFHQFIDSSGGRSGKGAVENFEEVVLAQPKPPIKGVERPAEAPVTALPATAADLDAVWKDWVIALRDEQQGKTEVPRPYQQWGRFAALEGNYTVAAEDYEKGLVADPTNVELLMEFADLLAQHFANPDRGAKLVMEALHVLERANPRDEKAISAAERALAKLDPKRANLTNVLDDLLAAVTGLVQRYEGAGLPMMVMDIAWRFGRDLEFSQLFPLYEASVRKTGKSLEIWELAYDEATLKGWNVQGNDGAYRPNGTILDSTFGTFDEKNFDFQMLTMDKVASGDFSMEADVAGQKGEVNFAGFVFGRKNATSFHGMLFFPGKRVAEGGAETGFVDLMSSFGGTIKTWNHHSVDAKPKDLGNGGTSSGENWHRLRLDVSGRFVDLTFDGELLGSHEFASIDVLRGSFGLVCSPGKARFREVRYLARDPQDPASAIQRAIRMEKMRPEEGGAVGGSFFGKVPPWPKVARWAQGSRSSWKELGPVPQLLTFLSIDQNELVRVDNWLLDLAKRTEGAGLAFVSVWSPNDEPKLDAYLQSHPLPGAVAVDHREGVGIGDANEQFYTRRFNLPRLLLLDVDHKVIWEGDPGFEIGKGWDPSTETYLDAPLAELLEKRKLVELTAWRARWNDRAVPALSRGALEDALPILREALDYEGGLYPEVDLARSRLGALEGALHSLETTALSFEREEATPALEALLAWAPLFEVEVTPKIKKDLKPHLEGEQMKAWKSVAKATERFQKAKTEFAKRAEELLAAIDPLPGRFPRELASDLHAALDAGDQAAFEKAVAAAHERPKTWLARTYFGW